MKEVRLKMCDEEYQKLVESAKGDMRSVTKQATLYIMKGIEADQQNQSA